MKTFGVRVEVVTFKTFKSCIHVEYFTQKCDLLPEVLHGVVDIRLNSHATVLGSNPTAFGIFLSQTSTPCPMSYCYHRF
jgi:hypothetical protein